MTSQNSDFLLKTTCNEIKKGKIYHIDEQMLSKLSRNLTHPKAILDDLTVLFQDYIQIDSPFELNLSTRAKTGILQKCFHVEIENGNLNRKSFLKSTSNFNL